MSTGRTMKTTPRQRLALHRQQSSQQSICCRQLFSVERNWRIGQRIVEQEIEPEHHVLNTESM